MLSPATLPPRLPFDERPSVETLATLGEDEAVRRRCDARNFRVLRWSFRIFLAAAGIELVTATLDGAPDILGASDAGANILFAILALLVLRRIDPQGARSARLAVLDPLARRVVQSFRAATLLSLAIQAILLVVFSAHAGGAQPWLVTLAFLFPLLRLLPSEAFLLHGLLIALAFGAQLVPVQSRPAPKEGRRASTPRSDSVVPAVACNAAGLAIGLLSTRRFRRQVLGEWRALREGARDQLRMRDELDFARRVQLSMLPAESPKFGWLDVDGRSLPATEVGGDYFDYFPIDADRVAVVSADVAGHGLASGLILSGLRSCLALLADELGEPAAVARKLDRMVRQTTSHRMLVALAIALFDRARSTATVTSAGHPPVLKRSAASGLVTPIAFASLPLGAKLPGALEERQIPFASGDVFLLYTDGVYEALDARGEPYGLDRLARFLEGLPAGFSPPSICDAILADLASFTGQAPAHDDITLVAVRIR
jgi:serine phosphatase RsbU (regulator of sigma subunit)